MKARWMSKIDNKKYEAGIISNRCGHEVETFIVYSQGFFSMLKKIPVNTCDINNYEKENKELLEMSDEDIKEFIISRVESELKSIKRVNRFGIIKESEVYDIL